MASPIAGSLLTEHRPSQAGLWLGRLLALGYRLAGEHKYDNLHLERIDNYDILIMPSVANPRALRTGALLATQSANHPLNPTDRVLDLGCGSGICALVLAERASQVVATDINPVAVRCTRINAHINDLENRIDARCGNLFEPVAGEKFDLITFNPPFILGEPRDHRDAAWRSSGLAERFATELPAMLTPIGAALLCLSSFGDACPVFEAELIARGLQLELFARQRLLNETITILRVTAPDAPGTGQ